jgi:cyclic-di-GMP-binding protein
MGVPVDDALNRARRRGTLTEAYKHALLLDLADPYHLPSHLIVKIDQYLESSVELALLRPAPPVEAHCQFLIDIEGDRAGMVHSAATVLEQLERYRVLNTVELARAIHAQLTQLQAGELPVLAGLPADFFTDNGIEMLTRLINVWGVNPKRSFRRSERPDTKVDVAVGIDTINYWLNGGRRLEGSAGSVGPEPDRASHGTFGNQQIKSASAPRYDYTAWNIEDESAGGMALSKSGMVRRRVRVGDVLATRFDSDQGWTISVVRWVKSANPSNIEIGAQRLAPAAQPVLVKAVAGDKEESDYLAALHLPAIPALKEPETLMLPAALFRPNRVFYLDDGKHLQRVVVQQILEAASGFDRVTFVTEAP